MRIFKKKEQSSCCCLNGCQADTIKRAEQLKKSSGIMILGSGCKKCNDLENVVVSALKELNRNDEIQHITDVMMIATFGVMTTPALVVNGNVVSYGKVLKKEEVIDILKKE